MLPWKKKKKKCKPKTKSYNKVPAWIQKGISSTWILLSQSNSNFFNFKPDPANYFGRSPRANLILQHILCGLNGACTLLASLLPTSPLPDILRTPSQRVSSHQTHFTSHHVELTLPRVSISVCFILSPNISKSHSLLHVIIMHLSSLPQGAALSGGIKAWQLSALPSMPNLFGLMDNGYISAEHFCPDPTSFQAASINSSITALSFLSLGYPKNEKSASFSNILEVWCFLSEEELPQGQGRRAGASSYCRHLDQKHASIETSPAKSYFSSVFQLFKNISSLMEF